jgi:hypothetical protein
MTPTTCLIFLLFSGIVGSIVLPVLGAVPDAAIVIYSGLGSDAQSQMEVGIGALAGSTILLLTVPWCMTVIAGRVNIDDTGKAVYKAPKLTPPDNFDLFRTGVTVASNAKSSAVVALVTAVSYWIIEGSAIGYRDDTDDQLITMQYPYAAASFALAITFFIGYLTMSYLNDDPASRDKNLIEGLKDGKITLVAAVAGIMEEVGYDPSQPENTSEGTALVNGKGPKEAEVRRRLEAILWPAFTKYDLDNSGGLDVDEVAFVLKDLGEKMTPGTYFL